MIIPKPACSSKISEKVMNTNTIFTSPKLFCSSHPHPILKIQSQRIYPQTHIPAKKSPSSSSSDPISYSEIKTLAQFDSLHNKIRVLQISRRSDHPFAGSRLLLLDSPGNIQSICFLFRAFTQTYFDVFATFPPILPSGPSAILGFGAGSTARLLHHLYPDSFSEHLNIIHGYEIDPSVISVAREYFGLEKLEKQMGKALIIHVMDALDAEVENGFAGVYVDLFSKGSLLPELQTKETWAKIKRKLKRGRRVMVNCGGRCVEAEDERRDGEALKEETLRVMSEVFGKGKVWVLKLGFEKEDSWVAFTGEDVDRAAWKGSLVKELRWYVDMWRPYSQ